MILFEVERKTGCNTSEARDANSSCMAPFKVFLSGKTIFENLDLRGVSTSSN